MTQTALNVVCPQCGEAQVTIDETGGLRCPACDLCGVSGRAEQDAPVWRLWAAARAYYDAAEAIRAHVVAAERLDDGQECHIPAHMIRALLEAHRSAYTVPPAIAAAKGTA